MNRVFIYAVALTTLTLHSVMAQPPDSVVGSGPAIAPHETAPTETAPISASHPDRYHEQATGEEASRAALWNSEEMQEARQYVLDYSERSARSSRTQGERYLSEVSKLSAASMRQWLVQLQQRRGAMQGQQQFAQAARQATVEQALQKNHESRQAAFNAQQAKAWMADYWQYLVEMEEANLEEAPLDRKARLAAALEAQRLQFDPFAPATDPVSPDALTRYAAAAALPGDLPRGDPANFSTGEGGGATGGVSGGGAAAVAAPSAASSAAAPSGE